VRVCLVSREVLPFFGAGIGVYVSLMARAWASAGHKVHVVSEPHARLEEDGPALHPGVRFHATRPDRGEAALDGFYSPLARHAMAAHELLTRLHADHRFDYIEFPDFGGEGFFALRARRTLGAYAGAVMAVRLHTPLADCIELNADPMLDRETANILAIEGWAVRDADALVSPCHDLLTRVRARYGPDVGEGRTPGLVVPYAFDMGALGELGPPADHPGGSRQGRGRATVLYTGRTERRKGVHVLIGAAQRLFDEGLDFEVRIVGGDTATGPGNTSMRAHLERLARRSHPERFHFEGRRPRSELGQRISGATACCFPSLWENFPNACLEAMALGAAVVGSNAGGMAEQIEDGTSGLLFEAGDEASLADALRRVLTDAQLRERLRSAAPARVAELCRPPAVVAQMEEAIASVRPRAAALCPAGSGAGPASPPRGRAPAAAPARNGRPPDASIIIPFYNMARWLPQTLSSALSQTHGNIEVIVVDDGSTEPSSVAMVASLEREGVVRVVRKANGGLGSARNAGIAAARGRWVVPLDADDLLDRTFVAKALAAAAAPGVSSRPLAFVTSLVAAFPERPEHAPWIWIPLGLERDMLAASNVASCCVALIDREAALAVGGYDQWLTSYEDWDFYCALAERGYRAEVIPERLIYYRQREDSMRHRVGEPRLAHFRALIQQRHPGLAEHPDVAFRVLAGELAPNESVYLRNPRYQAIDRINDAFKRTPLHAPLKSLVLRAMRVEAAR